MNKERSELLGNMQVKKLLIKLAIPATVAMLVNSLYNLVDTLFVAWGAGEIAIGALSIAYPVQMIVLAIGLMIGIGSASVFSRAYGRQDKEDMARSVHTALFMGTVLSVTISIIGIIFIDDLLRLFGASASNIDYARDYLFWILIGLIPFSLSVILNNLARAEGRANVAMISLIIGAGVNILLDPFFIFEFGLDLGVAGAAIATVIAKTASFIYVFTASLSKSSSLNINIRNIFKVDLKMFGEISAIGMPTFVRNSLGAVLVILINNLINFYAAGDPAIYISIFGVINRMIMFLLMPGFGLVQGLQPIVGFNFGAKFYRRLHDVITYATKLIFIYFVSAFAVTILFANVLFMIFSRDADPYFIETGASALRVVSVGFILIGFQVVLSSVYQAMGYPVRAFIVALSRQFILFIPLVFLFTYLFGIEGIWITFLASDLIAGGVSYLVYKYEMRDLATKFEPIAETA